MALPSTLSSRRLFHARCGVALVARGGTAFSESRSAVRALLGIVLEALQLLNNHSSHTNGHDGEVDAGGGLGLAGGGDDTAAEFCLAVAGENATLGKTAAFSRGGFPQLYLARNRHRFVTLDEAKKMGAGGVSELILDGIRAVDQLLRGAQRQQQQERDPVHELDPRDGKGERREDDDAFRENRGLPEAKEPLESALDAGGVLSGEMGRARIFLRGCDLTFLAVNNPNEEVAALVAHALAGEVPAVFVDEVTVGGAVSAEKASGHDVGPTAHVVSPPGSVRDTSDPSTERGGLLVAELIGRGSPEFGSPPPSMFTASDEIQVGDADAAAPEKTSAPSRTTSIAPPHEPSVASSVIGASVWAGRQAYDYLWGTGSGGGDGLGDSTEVVEEAPEDAQARRSEPAGGASSVPSASLTAGQSSRLREDFVDAEVIRTNWYGRETRRTFRFFPDTVQRIEIDPLGGVNVRAEWFYTQILSVEIENGQKVTITFAEAGEKELLTMTNADEFVQLILARAPLSHSLRIVRNMEKKMEKHAVQTIALPCGASMCLCKMHDEALSEPPFHGGSLLSRGVAPRWARADGISPHQMDGEASAPPSHSMAILRAAAFFAVDTEEVRNISVERWDGAEMAREGLADMGRAATVPVTPLALQPHSASQGGLFAEKEALSALGKLFNHTEVIPVTYDVAKEPATPRTKRTVGWFTEQSGIVAELVSVTDFVNNVVDLSLFAMERSDFVGVWREDARCWRWLFEGAEEWSLLGGGTTKDKPWCERCGTVTSPVSLSPDARMAAFVVKTGDLVIHRLDPAVVLQRREARSANPSPVRFAHPKAIAVLRSTNNG